MLKWSCLQMQVVMNAYIIYIPLMIQTSVPVDKSYPNIKNITCMYPWITTYAQNSSTFRLRKKCYNCRAKSRLARVQMNKFWIYVLAGMQLTKVLMMTTPMTIEGIGNAFQTLR